MIHPFKYLGGLNAFCECYGLSGFWDVGLIFIPSRVGHRFEKGVLNLLPVRYEDVFYCIPPDSVGQHHEPRSEKFPAIPHSIHGCIIADDAIETGKTLEFTVKRLIQAGIPEDRVWFFVAGMVIRGFGEEGPFFDRARVFLDYVGELTGK